ncbi:MAG: sugar ABC transporter ATP-binding protein [Peptoniphilaceae bacterium]|nr:sugar ABC transporter ATP-binding protein [Peptoniphilaceae bacterium]MDY6086217.1 sugar ABC transporter ATP-binding protein [Peptoniphilaceae bacterium]
MENIIELKDITKKFPGVTALDHVSFGVRKGEVHCLLGENGAGKSTLMKILSGVYTPTDGKIIMDDKEWDHLTPTLSQESGIRIIYQELSVIDTLSIQENVFLGRLPQKQGLIPTVDYESMRKKTTEVLSMIGLRRDPETLVGDLSISEKQMVEIAKAIAFDAKLIIMDEPTSSLVQTEIDHLLDIVKGIKAQGNSVIYISHKLSEIKRIGDRVTVLKDGKYVVTKDADELDRDTMIRLMVGRDIQSEYVAASQQSDEVILEVKNITRADHKVKDVSFTLHKGEILGFSGLVGAGRTELMEAIYGASTLDSGEIFLYGEKVTPKTPYDALKKGIGLVTENRRETGFAPYFSIKQNISQATFLRQTKWGGLSGFIDKELENRVANEQKEAMKIKSSSLGQIITELSGGNQQKVILGRWLASQPKVLILDEPTKGIDVGTKADIYKIMRRLSDEGIGIMMVSSELPELLSVCDRIIVMNDGVVTGCFTHEEATEERLIKAGSREAGE